MADLLDIRDVAFSIGGKAVLQGITLSIAPQEIHALVGTNGTGKTVLARLIMGCEGYVPAAGEIRFRGRLLNPLPLHERARLGLTMAWQEPARFEGLSTADYIALGHAEVDPGDLLRRVGLDPGEYLRRMVDKGLSGGERKRIELASVLALRPAFAILDEPTAGIDLLSVGEIDDVIRAFRDAGASVLLITHQEDIARIADRASQLCGGRIVLTGDPHDVAESYKARRCIRCDGETCERE